MIYGQIILKESGSISNYVKFIFHRKDIHKIVYEFNNEIYQDPEDLFSILSIEDIERYYDNEINFNKIKINKLKKRFCKLNRKNYLDGLKDFNENIKLLKIKIDEIQTLNALNNIDDNDDDLLQELKFKKLIYKNKKHFFERDYEKISARNWELKELIKNYKNTIGELKQKKKNIIFDENDLKNLQKLS